MNQEELPFAYRHEALMMVLHPLEAPLGGFSLGLVTAAEVIWTEAGFCHALTETLSTKFYSYLCVHTYLCKDRGGEEVRGWGGGGWVSRPKNL